MNFVHFLSCSFVKVSDNVSSNLERITEGLQANKQQKDVLYGHLFLMGW
jgi:hypothetical protein